MEITTTELSVIETIVHDATHSEIRELDEFQLALIGGGIGDVLVG
jgi:hypothetical protein